MNWFRKHSRWLMLGTASLLLSAFTIFLYNSSEWTWADWTGIGKDTSEIEEETLQNGKLTPTKRITHYQSGKNIWDWMGLAGVIAIPFVLFRFQQQQQKKSEENAEAEKKQAVERAKVEKEQAVERAKVEREIADNNLREEALRDYIDKIAELLIDKELKVLLKQLSEKIITNDDPKLDALLDVARARTLSILRRLDGDGERKGSVVRFLIDAELIQGLELLKEANLRSANLSFANLEGANLSFANLIGAYLSQAELSFANLVRANLSQANLSQTYLTQANVFQTNLSQADLSKTNLIGANLRRANLSQTNLLQANLEGAKLQGAIDLTPEQIKTAKNWEKAIYDPDFRNQLGLPPENNL